MPGGAETRDVYMTYVFHFTQYVMSSRLHFQASTVRARAGQQSAHISFGKNRWKRSITVDEAA
jgi:hypothetical protein